MADEKTFDILNPFETINFQFEDWADGVKEWSFENREFFRPLREPLDWMINGIQSSLLGMPQVVVLILVALIAWQSAGWRIAILVAVALSVMGMLGDRAWDLGMTTLAIVVSAVIICAAIGLPLGVMSGKSDIGNAAIRPVLDTMQTIPAFVYLIPVVMLLGIGNVPGVIVTVVFALPPLIRLTSLGIRQVNPSMVEAAKAFGATSRQILFKVELPLAAPSIMAGINQTIMLSLSMVVIASMISVKGFGNEVLRAIGRLDAGKAMVGGIGIVILAVVLDRITQGLGKSGRERGCRHWYNQGPIGLAIRMWHSQKSRSENLQSEKDSAIAQDSPAAITQT